MLADKVTAILKGLPKSLRKHYVPVPNYVEAFCAAATFGKGDLYEALALQLLRMTGTRVDAEVLRAVELEPHHWFNLRLRDENDRVVGQGRDWEALNRRFGDQAEAALQAGPSEQWGREGITRWDFGELPASLHLRQAGGIEVEVWPALVDRQDSVELKVLPSPDLARQASLPGVCRLLLLSLPAQQLKSLRRELPHLTQSLMLTGKRFNRNQLEDEALLLAARRAAGLTPDQLPRNRSQFDSLCERMRSQIAEVLARVGQFIYQCHQSVHRINKQLSGRIDLQAVPVLNDIKQQLAELIHPHYLSQTEEEWLQQYPRYLEAIEIRLEKYRRDLRQQCLLSDQLGQFWQAYKSKAEEYRARHECPPELRRFRWLLEEYRVSLFAQQLGTRQTVSDKRLRQALAEL